MLQYLSDPSYYIKFEDHRLRSANLIIQLLKNNLERNAISLQLQFMLLMQDMANSAKASRHFRNLVVEYRGYRKGKGDSF